MFARGGTPIRKASVTKTAAPMPLALGLGALCVAVAGCGSAATPTSLFLTIESETAANPPPDEMQISVFGKFGAIFQDAPLPASGPLVVRNPTSFGTVTIYVPENTGHARLDVRTRIQGSPQLEGTVEIDVRAGQQVAVTVKLRASSASDGDGDGVPDPIDNCRVTPNADQADADGNGIGDLCDAGFDGGNDAARDIAGDTGTDAGSDEKADTKADTATPADARLDATPDVVTDASSEGSADTRSDTTVRVDAGPDGVTDAGTGVESGPPSTGMVTITEIGFRADVNLTVEGTTDWAHWGATSATSFNHKATGGGKISDLTQRGGFRYSTSMTTFAWSDGSPTVSDSNSSGVYNIGGTSSFSFTVAADTSARTLRLYVGGNAADNRLTAHLSDTSAPDAIFSTTGRAAGGAYVMPLEIIFRSASTQQTLTLTWAPLGSGGITSINGATLF
jgi:hypothetical protein